MAEPDVQAADIVVIGGDALAGPFPVEVLDLLEGLGGRAQFLMGNADRELVAPAGATDGPPSTIVDWCRARLGPEMLERVGWWPPLVELAVDGLGAVVFCHATVSSDTDLITCVTPDADVAASLGGVRANLVVCGHVHVAYDRRIAGAPRLVNAGSVGMPYEGAPGAYWALLGPDVAFRRSTYDLSAAVEAIRATGYPGTDDMVDDALRGGIAPDEVSRFFEEQRRGA